MAYLDEYKKSIETPTAFWKEKAEALDWFKFPQQILSKDENGIDRWFADGEMNTAHMALDYHIEAGRGDQVAIYYDSPVTDTKRAITYTELRDQVAKFAGVLQNQGVKKGDRVVIYMPMIPEAAVAMLATARLGAIHSVASRSLKSSLTSRCWTKRLPCLPTNHKNALFSNALRLLRR